MAKIYDIVTRLSNERPRIKFAEGVEFKVNTSLKGAIAIKAIADDETKDEFEGFREIVAIGIGQEGLSYLETQEISIKDWMLIVETISAAMLEEDLDEVEKGLHAEKK